MLPRTLLLSALAAIPLLVSCRSGMEADATGRTLPAGAGTDGPELGWGVSSLSAASAREEPMHKAELGTQILMGHPVELLSRTGGWYRVRSADGYCAWMAKGTVQVCDAVRFEGWTNEHGLLIVTVMEDVVRETPQPGAPAVSDVVIANRLRRGSANPPPGWVSVELPGGRTGFLRSDSVEPLTSWRQSRRPTPENIEACARQFVGRPYLWGGNSPKGLDCSGFTKLVFHLNGIELLRNASQQATQGREVPLDPGLTRLRKGDLIFFGGRYRDGQPPRITHVGIYLGGLDRTFIHSYDRVQIGSLDHPSPLEDAPPMRRPLLARRLLPD